MVALARTADKGSALRAIGAQPALADALDRDALRNVIIQSWPEAVIHQLTALSGPLDFRKFDEGLALTNRLRTEALDTMLEAAHAVGAVRFIAQSFCGWTYARTGGPVKSETDPLDPTPARGFEKTLGAIRRLEDVVASARGLRAFALRYGYLYGPGTSIAGAGGIVQMVRKRRMPVVGGGTGVWSFIHVDDAARATVATLSRGTPGVYNVVDDEPAPVATWLPHLASAVGARPPRKVPAWLGKLVLGAGGVAMMTENRGASNLKAKRELDWKLEFPSWRQGFSEGLG